LPVVIPCGLHFRKRHIFRTDAYVEFGKPIYIEDDDIPDELVEAVSRNDWVEPDRNNVVKLRDSLHEVLRPMTPDLHSHEEHSTTNLIGHYKARYEGKNFNSWIHEVENTRSVREMLRAKHGWNYSEREQGERPPKMDVPLVKKASKLNDILSNHKLNGRDLDNSGEKLRKNDLKSTPLNILIIIGFIALSPFFVLSMGLQIFFGQIMGNTTDEGLDARTTFHLLTALFGSTLVWPAAALLVSISFVMNAQAILGTSNTLPAIPVFVCVFVLSMFIFRISCSLAVLSWDIYMDFKRALRRRKCSKLHANNIKQQALEIKKELTHYM